MRGASQSWGRSPADPCLELELELGRVHLGLCPAWQSAYWVMGPIDLRAPPTWPPSLRAWWTGSSASRFTVSRKKMLPAS